MNLDTELLKKILYGGYLFRDHLLVDTRLEQSEFTRDEWVRLIELANQMYGLTKII